MLSIFKEARDYVANHLIIENICIEKMCKQLFFTKLILGIILKGGWLRIKWFIKVQKNQWLFLNSRSIVICRWTKSYQIYYGSFLSIYLLVPVLVSWSKIFWFGYCPDFRPDLFVFDFLSLLLTSDLLFQFLYLLIFGAVGSARQ